MRGYRFAIRPVAYDDVDFIIDVRRGNPFIGQGANSRHGQFEWLKTYFERADDYYFVIEDSATRVPQGLAGVYRIDAARNCAEWGRWVLRPDSIAAVESALLIYRCAFDDLDLRMLYCRTLLENAQVISFHDSCGLRRSHEPVTITVDGTARQAVEHRLERAHFAAVEQKLSSIAARLHSRVTAAPT